MSMSAGFNEWRGGQVGVVVESLLKRGAGPVLDRIIGASLSGDEVRRRAGALPLHKAEIGVATVAEGEEKSDPELRRLGAAMVVAAWNDVDSPNTDNSSDEVATAVTDIVATLPLQDIQDNPYISAPAAEKASTILGLR